MSCFSLLVSCSCFSCGDWTEEEGDNSTTGETTVYAVSSCAYLMEFNGVYGGQAPGWQVNFFYIRLIVTRSAILV